ncbi:P4HA [Mytilus coruscus]|uniref:procollagen-proline 4-dioxygenase n=1 Tax=Mytilus coruscus TaxID=42192 RepID=A0A6J8BZD5_MYTCO|nr:P4HA [Mytilus coruscus]
MISLNGLLVLFFQILSLHHVNSDVFSSVYKLKLLAIKEGRLLEIFKEYKESISSGKIMSASLNILYDQLEHTVNVSSRDESYQENPLNILHLLHRYLHKWPLVLDNVFCDSCLISDPERDFASAYNKFKEDCPDWPIEYDLQGAVRSLLRLRTTYILDIDELITGEIHGEKTEALPWDLLELILVETEALQMLDETIQWCDSILNSFQNTLTEQSNRFRISIIQTKARIYHKASFTRNAAKILEEFKEEGTLSVKEDYQLYLKESTDNLENLDEIASVKDWPIHKREIDNHEKQLCRGKQKKSTQESSKLYCYYSNTRIPYYKAKAEEMNKDPKIFVFHDVIYEHEMDFLKREAYKKFQRSGLQQYGKGVDNSDDIRLSYTGWVWSTDLTARRVTHRIHLITGLDTTDRSLFSSSEAYQVVNYGIGGFFNVHRDNLYNPIWGPPAGEDHESVRGSGDRVATWIFYMNDVREGGATIFSELNTRIPVEKGAAAFWYNLLPNGEIDTRLLHGGCPVLLGSKWISNKWIREEGQMFRRPCRLQYNATT